MSISKTKVEIPAIFEKMYPSIAEWVDSYGWLEIGQDEYSRSMVRALNEGGMVWEGKTKYKTLDALFHDLELGLSKWLEENG
ncbi:MAG: hypothetical protein WAV07_14210 [Candidatus Contendobacter sp.]